MTIQIHRIILAGVVFLLASSTSDAFEPSEKTIRKHAAGVLKGKRPPKSYTSKGPKYNFTLHKKTLDGSKQGLWAVAYGGTLNHSQSYLAREVVVEEAALSTNHGRKGEYRASKDKIMFKRIGENLIRARGVVNGERFQRFGKIDGGSVEIFFTDSIHIKTNRGPAELFRLMGQAIIQQMTPAKN